MKGSMACCMQVVMSSALGNTSISSGLSLDMRHVGLGAFSGWGI